MATTTVNINTALKINVTPIESGTAGHVLFQNSANQVSQSSYLFWDNTNSRLSIGQGSSPSARLDVRSQGILSSDLAIRVRNSLDTSNFFEVRGNGTTLISAPANAFTSGFAVTVGGQSRFSADQYRGYLHGMHYVETLGTSGSGSIALVSGLALSEQMSIRPNFGSISIGSTVALGNGRNCIYFKMPVTPNTPEAVVNTAIHYPAQHLGITVNAFKNSNNDEIKLFKSSALTASDGTLANAVTRIAELEARLQANGLIA